LDKADAQRRQPGVEAAVLAVLCTLDQKSKIFEVG
jgi:hypothetical protein